VLIKSYSILVQRKGALFKFGDADIIDVIILNQEISTIEFIVALL
jgi:hypothetical protein